MQKQLIKVITISVLMMFTLNSASAHSWHHWKNKATEIAAAGGAAVAGTKLLNTVGKAIIKRGEILAEEFSLDFIAAVEEASVAEAVEAAAIALIV